MRTLLSQYIANSFNQFRGLFPHLVRLSANIRRRSWLRSALSTPGFAAIAFLVIGGIDAQAQVVAWEADIPPVDAGFVLVSQNPILETWLDNGYYYQYVERPSPRDVFASEFFQTSIPQFDCAPELFFEWRSHSNGNEEFLYGGPSAFAIGNVGGTRYTFFIANDAVKYSTYNFMVLLFLSIEPDVPHTYRIELYADEWYTVFIDGKVIDEGVPTNPLCGFNPKVTWGARSAFDPSTTQWDYIRYGDIPEPGSFDFDSDGDVDESDYYFVHDCLTKDGLGNYGGPGAPCPEGDETCAKIAPLTTAGPGCAFADSDADGDVDLKDIAAFQNAYTGEGD